MTDCSAVNTPHWSMMLMVGLFLVIETPQVLAETVSVSDRTGIITHDQIPAAGATEEAVFLSVPHLRQEPNLCVPTSAAMVLASFGDPYTPRELKTLSRGRTYDPQAPFTDFTITWWRDLISAMKPLGYSWFERGFANTPDGFRSGRESIRASVRSGNPVLVDVALFGSHTFVIVGYDDNLRSFYINDPNLASPGIRQLTFQQLESIWNGKSYGVDMRPALFTSRKPPDTATIDTEKSRGPIAEEPVEAWISEVRAPQYFAVLVEDVDRSAEWYRTAFGLRNLGGSQADDGSWRIVNLRNRSLFVEIIRDDRAQEVDRARGFFKVGFEVPNVELVASRVARATKERPRVIDDAAHGVRIVQLRDPDGNIIQLSSPFTNQE